MLELGFFDFNEKDFQENKEFFNIPNNRTQRMIMDVKENQIFYNWMRNLKIVVADDDVFNNEILFDML